MKNFRKLSALILSALASFTLLVGCGAAPVEDTTPRRECVRCRRNRPGDHAGSQPRRNVGPAE